MLVDVIGVNMKGISAREWFDLMVPTVITLH